MKSTELYQRILGLGGPWKVKDVSLDVAGRSVSIEVVHDPGEALHCPECGRPCPGYDSTRRSWRHLGTCQMQTILSAEMPRANCPEHGIRQVSAPWAEPGSRGLPFMALFEWVVVGWLEVAPITAVAKLMGLTWDQVDGIRHRAVTRGLARRKLEAPRMVGLDETSTKRGHEYFTVMTDVERSIVLHVAEGRSGESLVECFDQLGEEQVAGIEVVAMDMSGATSRPCDRPFPTRTRRSPSTSSTSPSCSARPWTRSAARRRRSWRVARTTDRRSLATSG